MKKIFNYIMLLAVAITGLTLTACTEDDITTDQYRGGVSLSAYGPQPVMRGGYLRFLGSNLDQIREIQIPGVDPITNIEVVQSGIPSEIRIVVPKDGPQTGYVTLISKSDEYITTKTQLSYDEPISIESVTETAMPGDVIEIKGDYLSLIHMIEFAENVWVSEDDFVSHDRYSITVRVPEKARTGILNLYTADLTKVDDPDALSYNIIPTENALIVGTPTVVKLASPRGEAEALGNVTIKQGEELSITGEYFQLVDSVKFGGNGNDSVYVKALTVAEDGKSIKLTLPAEAPDGPVNLVAKSGVEVPVGAITTVAPSECVAAPSPVKAGQALTITGKDLDVVSSITMDGAGEVEFAYANGKITIKAVPETAVDGNASLIMKNGKSTAVAYTLVKPEATKYDNNPVNAGGALVITGTNLDLIKSIAFGDGVYTIAEGDCSADGTTIKLTVPMDAQTGAPKATLANGTEVAMPAITIKEAVFCYVTAWPDEDNTPEAGATLVVPVKNADHLQKVYFNGEEVQFVINTKTSELIIPIPNDAEATNKLRLLSDNGEITYNEVAVIPSTEKVTVLWKGASKLAWSGDGQVFLGEDGAAPLVAANGKVGDVLRIKFTILASDWCFQVWNGHWGTQFDEVKPEKYDLAANKGCYYLTITEDILKLITKKEGWGGTLLVQGQQLVVTELALVQTISREINLVGNLFDCKDATKAVAPPFTLSWTDGDPGKFRIMRKGATDLTTYKWKAGQSKLIIYKSGTGQAQINRPNWNGSVTIADWVGDQTVLEQPLTQEMIDGLTGADQDGWSETAIIIQGDGLNVSKITLLP